MECTDCVHKTLKLARLIGELRTASTLQSIYSFDLCCCCCYYWFLFVYLLCFFFEQRWNRIAYVNSFHCIASL